jgi:hypothetical protein
VDEAVGKYSTPLLFEGEAANSSLSIVKRREEHPYSFSIDSHRAFEVARAILLFFFICSNIPWIVLVIWSLCGGFGKREEEKSLTNQHFANARSPRLRGNWQGFVQEGRDTSPNCFAFKEINPGANQEGSVKCAKYSNVPGTAIVSIICGNCDVAKKGKYERHVQFSIYGISI